MATPRYKLNVTIGEDSDRILVWKDNYKNPIDLTGYAFECLLYSDATTLIGTFSTANGGITLDPLNGKIRIMFPASFTIDNKITPYANYVIWMTTPAPDLKRKSFLKGQLTFIES
ncbi:MAG TPA: hypothetical protein VFM18_13830 [Methanosarcina sp.]|nr:hypothetical protein [Methanosarcina sp.]